MGNEHKASVFFSETSEAGKWQVRLVRHLVHLQAGATPQANGDFTDDTRFTLKLNGTTSFPITIASSAVSGNSNINDLAQDVNDAIASVLKGTEFESMVMATVQGDRLVLRSYGTKVSSITIDNLPQPTPPGVQRLGFAVAQTSDSSSGELIGGQTADQLQFLQFDAQTGKIAANTSDAAVFKDFLPAAGLETSQIRLYFTDATHRNDAFKAGWTAWGSTAQVEFDKSSEQVDLHVRVIGAGNTEIASSISPTTPTWRKLVVLCPMSLSASVSLDGLLDFNLGWNTKSNKPKSETITLKLNDFKAEIGLLVDQITIDARSKLGFLEAKIVDTPAFNSYIVGSVGFDVDLNNGQPITMAALKSAEVGNEKEISVDVNCDLDGVLFFESTIAGQPIPGSFWLALGLNATQLVATNPPVATAGFAQNTKFALMLTDSANVTQTIEVTLPATATNGNTSLVDLAADLEDAIQSALVDTQYAGKVTPQPSVRSWPLSATAMKSRRSPSMT